MVESQLEVVFLVIFILNMDRKLIAVEFINLGPSMARMALSRVAGQAMVGSAMTRQRQSHAQTSTRRLVRRRESEKVSMVVKFT